MGRMQASKILGAGSYSNSSITAARRWMTEIRQKVAAGTTTAQFTGGQTLMAPVQTIAITPFVSKGNGGVASATKASLFWTFSANSGFNMGNGTIIVKEATKTITKAVKLCVVLWGIPATKRLGGT